MNVLLRTLDSPCLVNLYADLFSICEKIGELVSDVKEFQFNLESSLTGLCSDLESDLDELSDTLETIQGQIPLIQMPVLCTRDITKSCPEGSSDGPSGECVAPDHFYEEGDLPWN